MDDLINRLLLSLNERFPELRRINIMICGKTGVGKSTLLNSIFGSELAMTGKGAPVTTDICPYSTRGLPLSLYDTPGFELGNVTSTLGKIEEQVMKGLKTNDINELIHCIWYCVSAPSSRIEPKEEEWIKRLLKVGSDANVPVIIILSQCVVDVQDRCDTICCIKSRFTDEEIPVVPVLAKDFSTPIGTIPAFGLNNLMLLTGGLLPRCLCVTLKSAFEVTLWEIQKKSHMTVAAAAGVTGLSSGLIPIPFSDYVVLVPEQITMLTTITGLFGFSIKKNVLMDLSTSILGTATTTYFGRTIVSQLLKMIPGVGPALGGFISGSVAAALTTALGEAYIVMMTKVYRGEMSIDDLSSEEGREMMADLFNHFLPDRRG